MLDRLVPAVTFAKLPQWPSLPPLAATRVRTVCVSLSSDPAAEPAEAPSARPALEFPAPLNASERAAYEALGDNSAWMPSLLKWCRFRGPKAAEALNGLVTNDVATLTVGQGQRALALSPKGRLVSDMLVIRIADDAFMLGMLEAALGEWLALTKKYVNPRLATVTDESGQWATWMIYGPRAPWAVAQLGGGAHTVEDLANVMVAGLADWPDWKHDLWNLGPATVRLIRAPLIRQLPGFLILADARDAETVQAGLAASGSPMASRGVWNVARVEGGRPTLGVDMDEQTIPQEANLDTLGAISFTKGCYTGQEVVARVHFRGHVNRHLRGLMADVPIPRFARVRDGGGRDVGDVRSTALSPRLGPIAMAMVRREVPLGGVVHIESDAGSIPARVVELPFTI